MSNNVLSLASGTPALSNIAPTGKSLNSDAKKKLSNAFSDLNDLGKAIEEYFRKGAAKPIV